MVLLDCHHLHRIHSARFKTWSTWIYNSHVLLPRRTCNKSLARNFILLKRKLLPKDFQKDFTTPAKIHNKTLISKSNEFWTNLEFIPPKVKPEYPKLAPSVHFSLASRFMMWCTSQKSFGLIVCHFEWMEHRLANSIWVTTCASASSWTANIAAACHLISLERS